MTTKQRTVAPNPFPGLRPFETDEYRLFFGREGQSDALVERLERSRFLAVVGTSGSGKSSLVRAGLLPALRGGMMAGAGAGWRVAVLRPGHDPLGNLARALAAEGVLAGTGAEDVPAGTGAEGVPAGTDSGLTAAEAEAVVEATLRRGSLGLFEVAGRARLAEREKLLVVVDQFEELFRFRAARAAAGATDDDAAAFVKLLLEVARRREVPVYVVLTMRSDFLGDCSQFQGLPEAINDGQYLIPRMTRDERRFAITGPVRVSRARMSEPLVNRLLNDVGDNPDQLPILQHALMRTWDYWAGHHRDTEPLGLEHYEAVGTMSEALSLHADEAWGELPDDRSRRVAEVLFKSLTERGADNREIRRPTRLREICEIADATPEEVAAVVEVFRREGRSFLMPPAGVPLTPGTVLDISHESLIRNWERLREWVRDEAEAARIYRRLAEAAAAYRAGEGGLLDDVTLGWVDRWREKYHPNRAWGVRYHPEFDEAIAYLEESRVAREAEAAERDRQRQAEVERERREREQAELFADRQRRLAGRMRWLAVGMAVMFILSLGTAAYAFKMGRAAVENEKKATDARRQAEKSEAEAHAFAAKLAEEKKLADEMAGRLKTAKEKTDEALAAEQAALDEQEKALEAQKAATARASAEADHARRAEATAKKATEAAQLNAEKLGISRLATTSHLEGIAAFERGDYEAALKSFVSAADFMLPPAAGTREFTEVVSYVRTKSALDADMAAAHHKLALAGKDAETHYARAIELYESALSEQQKLSTGPVEKGSWQKLLPIFELTHSLGHVYRDLAEYNGARRVGRTGKPLGIRSDPKNYGKAEEYYRQAVAIQGQINNLTGFLAPASKRVDSFQNLARLYTDLGKLDEAETYYERVTTVSGLDPKRPEHIEILKEVAHFYYAQNKYERAAGLYNQAIETQKGFNDEADAEMAELYGELGEVYVGLKDEGKATQAFRLVSLYQDLANKKTREDDARPLKALEEIGGIYERLGKFTWADRAYDRALDLRMSAEDGVRLKMKRAELGYKHLHEHDAAERGYKAVLEVTAARADMADTHARATQQLGFLYVETGRVADGLKLIDSALNYWERQANYQEIYALLYDVAYLRRALKQTDKLLAAERRMVEVAGALLDRNRHPRQTVRDAQEALARAGFSPGAAEGTSGPRTAAALRSFQRSKRLPETGKLDAATLAALGINVAWDGGEWDAYKYSEVFKLYVTAVGDLAEDLLESGRKAEATEAASLLLDGKKLDVRQIVTMDALDHYLRVLDNHDELLQASARPGPSPRDLKAELTEQARGRLREIEQITRGH